MVLCYLTVSPPPRCSWLELSLRYSAGRSSGEGRARSRGAAARSARAAAEQPRGAREQQGSFFWPRRRDFLTRRRTADGDGAAEAARLPSSTANSRRRRSCGGVGVCGMLACVRGRPVGRSPFDGSRPATEQRIDGDGEEAVFQI
jgi:hypothetical protein